MSALHEAVARAIGHELDRGVLGRGVLEQVLAAAAIRVVREYIATEEVPGIVAKAQRRERERVLAEAQHAIQGLPNVAAHTDDLAVDLDEALGAVLAALGEQA